MKVERVLAIECSVGDRHILVPADRVEQVRTYELSELPRSRAHVGGVAVCDEDLVVCLRLDGARGHERAGSSRVGRRTALGALLATTGPSSVRWAVELDRVVALVAVIDVTSPDGDTDDRWFGAASTDAGKRLPWLHVERLLAESGLETVRS